jgi:DNA-binding transcriptional regulator YiaG|tara:strand:- start:970 stop:1149 length:180 start_codon:yes stop_codon:yes gene_type:complete
MTDFKRLLLEKNISNENAASLFGVTVRTISRWKLGDQKAPKAIIILLNNIDVCKIDKVA